jgi:hypothetical protein
MNDEELTMYLMSHEPDLDPYAQSEWDNPVRAPVGNGHQQGCSYLQDAILAHCDCKTPIRFNLHKGPNQPA